MPRAAPAAAGDASCAIAPPRRQARTDDGTPLPLPRDRRLIERLDADSKQETVERLLRRRLSGVSWPRSALVAEGRGVGISELMIDDAAVRLNVETKDGRWLLAVNGHAAPVMPAKPVSNPPWPRRPRGAALGGAVR